MKNKISYFYTLSLIAFLIASCNPMRSSIKKGSSKLFETFYLGEKGTQYFVKPLYFENDKDKFSVDFTFIYNDKINPTDSATVNFSVFLPKNKKKEIPAFILQIEGKQKRSGVVKKLFQDVNQIRYSTKISVNDMKTFFEADNKSIFFGKKYLPKKATLRKIEKLRQEIFFTL